MGILAVCYHVNINNNFIYASMFTGLHVHRDSHRVLPNFCECSPGNHLGNYEDYNTQKSFNGRNLRPVCRKFSRFSFVVGFIHIFVTYCSSLLILSCR